MTGFAKTIYVNRKTKNSGKIKLSGFTFQGSDAEMDCWWADDNKIDAGNYGGIPSFMPSKNDGTTNNGLPFKAKDGAVVEGQFYREAIHLGPGVKGKRENGSPTLNNGVFIHLGTGASSSLGCIVTSKEFVYKIWDETKVFEKNGNLNTWTPRMAIIVTDLQQDEDNVPPAASPPAPGSAAPQTISGSFSLGL